MARRWRPGDQVWFLFNVPDEGRYTVKLFGYVERVEPRRIYVSSPKGREWISVTTHPMFASEREGLDWIRDNPRDTPSISERTERKR